MAVSQSKLAWLTSNLGLAWISASSFWLCGSLVAYPKFTDSYLVHFGLKWGNVSALAKQIGHVRYINILAWLRGFRVKILYLVLFYLYPSLFWELRDKRSLKNLQFWPESLGAMLEYWYIERGLLTKATVQLCLSGLITLFAICSWEGRVKVENYIELGPWVEEYITHQTYQQSL